MTYTWKCTKCGRLSEREYHLSHNKPATIKCEACGAVMHRVFNAPAIKYKGNGFYANDQWHPVEENPDDLK